MRKDRCYSMSKAHPYHLGNGNSVVCEPSQCAGCMACKDICPVNAIAVIDRLDHMDAEIDETKCISCGLCHKVCQKNHPACLQETTEVWQGWADEATRANSSSGGFATAIARAFIAQGGFVCSCQLQNGNFRFVLARNIKELEGFAGSKYVKSNPEGAYDSIASALRDGLNVLFIGLPCQASSLRNYVSMRCKLEMLERLYVIDLICHGTPSVKLLRRALEEYGQSLETVNKLWFRHNIDIGLATDGGRIVPEGCSDFYTMGFLSGICYTENCYSCSYATQNRVGDLTLGDAWGTNLADEERRGISLALIQNAKGQRLIDIAKLELRPINYGDALASNHQLVHPTQRPTNRNMFFAALRMTRSFRNAMTAAMPYRCAKQAFKSFLSKLLSKHKAR